MYLTKIVLNPRSAAARASLEDTQFMHRAVVLMFLEIETKNPRKEHGVLHFLKWEEGMPVLYVQSLTEPDPTRLPAEFTAHPVKIKETVYPDNLKAGDLIRFEVQATPTKAVKRPGKESVRRCLPQNEFNPWLIRRFAQMGIDVAHVDCGEKINTRGFKEGSAFHHAGALFCGTGIIKDDALAKTLIRNGLASGKAYGWGMIRVAVL